MSDECIHGFEPGMCAICFPKPVPEAAPRVATAATRPRAARAPRATAAPRSSSTGTRQAGAPAVLDDVSAQRVYHLTHVRNLAAIVGSGTIYADVADGRTERPEVDIARADTREARRMTPVSEAGADAVVAEFVPFFLSPNAIVWRGIRNDEDDYRLAAGVIEMDPAEFVLLVSTVKTLSGSGRQVVVADGDAAHVLTRFATTAHDAERSLRRLRADPTATEIDRAEYLVHGSVPFSEISLIGVAHDKARTAVREALAGAAHQPKVSVYPPWFAADEV